MLDGRKGKASISTSPNHDVLMTIPSFWDRAGTSLSSAHSPLQYIHPLYSFFPPSSPSLPSTFIDTNVSCTEIDPIYTVLIDPKPDSCNQFSKNNGVCIFFSSRSLSLSLSFSSLFFLVTILIIFDFILAGKVVGATVGAILGTAILVAAGLFVFLRYKRSRLTKAVYRSNLMETTK